MNPDKQEQQYNNNHHMYHGQQQQMQAQQKSAKIFNNQWILKKKVSSGSFGVVFIAVDKNTKQQVAIKLEKEDSEEIRSLEREVQILSRLQGLPNIPKLFFSGQENNYNIIVIQLLGPDLAHYMKNHKKLSIKTVLCLADQLIPILEKIHNRSVIHRDLKPENILMGLNDTETMGKVFLIDFGISKIYKDSNGRHISFKEDKPFIGTTRYASIAAHLGHELGRKDDLESLIYVLLFLILGKLPWQNLQNVPDGDKTTVVGEIKQKTSPAELCKDLPEEFKKYLEYVKKLHFKSTPDYQYLKQLFQKLGKQQGINYNQEYEYDWTILEKKKKQEMEEEKLRIQQLKQQQIEQQKQKKQEEELKKQQEQQQQLKQQQQQENGNNQHREYNKKQSLSCNGNNLAQWHRTSSLQAQEQKNVALLQPPNNQNSRNLLQPQSSKDSFLGSNLTNSFIGNNNSSVYMNYQASNNAKNGNGQVAASNLNFDDIDHEAEKVIKGSNINFDEDPQQQQNNKYKKPGYSYSDEEVPEEKSNNQSKDLFTVGTVGKSNIEEFQDGKNTLFSKYQHLQQTNGASNLKILKQKTKFSHPLK